MPPFGGVEVRFFLHKYDGCFKDTTLVKLHPGQLVLVIMKVQKL